MPSAERSVCCDFLWILTKIVKWPTSGRCTWFYTTFFKYLHKTLLITIFSKINPEVQRLVSRSSRPPTRLHVSGSIVLKTYVILTHLMIFIKTLGYDALCITDLDLKIFITRLMMHDRKSSHKNKETLQAVNSWKRVTM